MPTVGRVTQLLEDWNRGKPGAEASLLREVYPRLRRIAARRMRGERDGHSLRPTDLVHEAYTQLVDQREKSWANRSHFFAVCSHLMRRVLIDYARVHKAAKRGGNWRRVTLDEGLLGTIPAQSIDSFAEALDELSRLDARQARVVELRAFAGFENDEIARLLGVSDRTIKRDWTAARAWLHRRISEMSRA
jgi:RNA polymerase sigma factor (TIGR02999 family)